MKGVVAYDSVHGNTKQIAEAMAEQIKADGHEAELVSLKEGGKEVTGDFMFIGSPTRGGRMTKGAAAFVEKIDVAAWKGKPIVTFDTVGPLSKDEEKRKKWLATIDEGSKNAASRMKELARDRGLNVQAKPWHFAVTGFWGPLAPDAIALAKEHTHGFLATMK